MSKNYVKIEISKIPQPIFLDTSIFIYLFEDYPKYALAVSPIFDDTSIKKATSIITVSETLTKPYETNYLSLVEEYKEIFLHLPNLTVLSPDFDTSILAAEIKARFDFKMIDSLQLAIAQQNRCGSFLTNDKQLKRYKRLPIILLDQMVG